MKILNDRQLRIKWLKRVIFVIALVPFFRIAEGTYSGEIGADPVNLSIRALGDWGLRFLWIGLALTPLRQITGWSELIAYRRIIGLFGFFYVSMHLLDYLVIDQFFDWMAIGKDIVKRPYITFGMASFLMLVALAVTSNDALTRKMGGRNWQRLHRLVYFAAVGGAIHYYLLAKADKSEPLIYAAILLFLLGWRLVQSLRGRLVKANA